MPIYLTATVKSKPGNNEALKKLLLELVENSRQEEACVQYDLHQSQNDPDFFIFHEEWKSREGLDLHNNQPYILDFGVKSAELIDGQVGIHITSKLA
ncbi:putative quinol monooxygenase [Dyadobacter sp. NIV53]|uniref:putative quinol monooxygenase n=1 Tax=Dyadobacter sp. NIV53 TaxID=2861765 RepID=UPI001C86725B|nr:putative quinol monooxygenase [Dyadobacter sp. NIV53]